MKSLFTIIVGIVILETVQGWCLKTTVNLTEKVDRVDYSPDGTLIAATFRASKKVVFYDTTNYFPKFTYTHTNQIRTVRFSKDSNYYGVALNNGNIELFTVQATFSSTPDKTITTQGSSIN